MPTRCARPRREQPACHGNPATLRDLPWLAQLPGHYSSRVPDPSSTTLPVTWIPRSASTRSPSRDGRPPHRPGAASSRAGAAGRAREPAAEVRARRAGRRILDHRAVLREEEPHSTSPPSRAHRVRHRFARACRSSRASRSARAPAARRARARPSAIGITSCSTPVFTHSGSSHTRRRAGRPSARARRASPRPAASPAPSRPATSTRRRSRVTGTSRPSSRA